MGETREATLLGLTPYTGPYTYFVQLFPLNLSFSVQIKYHIYNLFCIVLNKIFSVCFASLLEGVVLQQGVEEGGGPATVREAGGPRLPRGEGPVATAVPPPPENYILATAQVLLLHCPPPAPPCG